MDRTYSTTDGARESHHSSDRVPKMRDTYICLSRYNITASLGSRTKIAGIAGWDNKRWLASLVPTLAASWRICSAFSLCLIIHLRTQSKRRTRSELPGTVVATHNPSTSH